MGGIAMPEDSASAVAARILALEKQVQTLLTATRLQSSTIDEPGSLQVRDSNGAIRLYAGMLTGAGQIGFELVRADGTLAFGFAGFPGDPTFHEVVQHYDRSGNMLFGDDEITGQGISRPYLHFPPIPSNLSIQSTTNNTMTNLWDLPGVKQHARLEVQVYAYIDTGGTTGEVDLYDDGTSTVIAGPTAFTSGGVPITLNGLVSGAHLATKALRVRARRTSAAGSVGIQIRTALGRS